VRAPVQESLDDVVVTAVLRKVRGPSGGGYGLIVRDQDSPADGSLVAQDGRFYVAEVGDRGEIGVWQRDGEQWRDLLPWTPSAAVRTNDGLNELTVRVQGTQLVFSVNGVVVTRQPVANLGPGSVGVFVGGDGNEAVLERFLVQTPDR